MSKITKTFIIDEKIYEKYVNICNIKNIDISSNIEKSIIKFISENYEIYTNKSYVFKYSDDIEPVKIIEKIDEYIILNNGNKINIFDFEKMYRIEDDIVITVLKDLGGMDNCDDVSIIEPDFLNNACISEKIVENIKNIDCDNIIYDKSEKELTESLNEATESLNEAIDSINNALSFEDRVEIVKRIKQKKSLISKDMDYNDLIVILEYIFSTPISFEIVSDNLTIVHVDDKFHNYIELNNILDILFTNYEKYQYKI